MLLSLLIVGNSYNEHNINSRYMKSGSKEYYHTCYARFFKGLHVEREK